MDRVWLGYILRFYHRDVDLVGEAALAHDGRDWSTEVCIGRQVLCSEHRKSQAKIQMNMKVILSLIAKMRMSTPVLREILSDTAIREGLSSDFSIIFTRMTIRQTR